MSSQRDIYRQISLLSLAGLGFFGIAFFTPDPGQHPGAFFSIATQTTWKHVLEWPAAWCSLKIILSSIGLFLVIESAGTILSLRKRKSLALSVFFLQTLPCLGFLFGSFYLMKSLL
jgi:hypothetical protein